MYPPITAKEFIDFVKAPDTIDEVPEIFKDNIKINWNIKIIDILNIPIRLEKKEYNNLLQETKQNIETLKTELRNKQNEQQFTDFMELRMENLIQRANTIKKRLASFGLRFNGPNRLEQAKRVPIDEIIEVRHGFAICPIHKETTASMKIYKNENRWHCFGACGRGGDVLDLIQLRDSVDLPTAIKILLCK